MISCQHLFLLILIVSLLLLEQNFMLLGHFTLACKLVSLTGLFHHFHSHWPVQCKLAFCSFHAFWGMHFRILLWDSGPSASVKDEICGFLSLALTHLFLILLLCNIKRSLIFEPDPPLGMIEMAERGAKEKRYSAGLHTCQRGVQWDVKVKRGLGCSDCELVEFRTPRGGRGVKSKFTSMGFRGADCLEESC